MNKTKHIIKIAEKEHEILICKKKIKSLRLKINSDNQITLSIPYYYSFTNAFNFLETKKDWIEKNLNKFKSKLKDKKCDFKENSTIYILGKEIYVKPILFRKNQIELKEDSLTLYLKNLSYDYALKQFTNWAIKYLDSIVNTFLNFYFEKYFSTLNKPSIKYKKMKSMWGNCKYTKGVITLNTYLIKAPTDCIEYVVVHELAHLIYHDHGKEFKNFLTTLLPNWKNIKKKLNEYSLYF